MAHATLAPNTAVTDQAADALNAAIALYKAAGWTAVQMGDTICNMWGMVPPAEAPLTPPEITDAQRAQIAKLRDPEFLDRAAVRDFVNDLCHMSLDEIAKEIDEVGGVVDTETAWLEALNAERRLRKTYLVTMSNDLFAYDYDEKEVEFSARDEEHARKLAEDHDRFATIGAVRLKDVLNG